MTARCSSYFPMGAALLAGGLLAVLTSGRVLAQTHNPGLLRGRNGPIDIARFGNFATGQHATNPSSSATPAAEEQLPTIDVLEGLRSGKLSASAEGTGDGRMTVHLPTAPAASSASSFPPA